MLGLKHLGKFHLPLGVLLPSIFLFLALSIKEVGIVKTDAAQRLSLFIPVLAAWLLFGEKFNGLKITAFGIAFPALLLILNKPSDNTKNNWMYPAIVLMGFGVIDILFKQIALFTTLPYTTSLFVVFGLALTIMTAVVGYEMGFKKAKINYKNLLFGSFGRSSQFWKHPVLPQSTSILCRKSFHRFCGDEYGRNPSWKSHGHLRF